MSDPVLVAYATMTGSTEEVAEAIAETLRACGLEIVLSRAREVRTLEGYGAVVLGAPLIMYHWHKDARRFLAHHRKALMDIPVALFAPGPTHVPHDEKEWADARMQLEQDLAKFSWLKPATIEIFGGKYDMAKLRFPLNRLAGSVPATDIRDFDAIHSWARALSATLAP